MTNIEFKYKGFHGTDAIQVYIEKRLHTLHRRLDERFHDAKVTIRGEVLSRNQEGHAKMFSAELIVKVPRTKNPFVVKKKDLDFRSACSEAVEAMEKVLRRDNAKRERNRKSLGHTHKSIRDLKRNIVIE